MSWMSVRDKKWKHPEKRKKLPTEY